MNCLHPDINNMRCWICPHNPFTRDMPPYVVCCAPLTPEMTARLRADCREDDLTITTFDVIFDLPAELDHASRDRIKNMGFHFADVPENSPIPGNTRFSFAPENAFTRNEEEDDNEDDEDEYWDEDDWDDEEDESEEAETPSAAAAAEEDLEQEPPRKNYFLIGAFLSGIAAFGLLFIKGKRLEIFSMALCAIASALTMISSVTFVSFYHVTENPEMADLITVKTRYGIYVVLVTFILGGLAALKEHFDQNSSDGY